jgi:aspartokinase
VEERLGGVKILKDVVWTGLSEPGGSLGRAMDLCRKLADARINIVFMTLAGAGDAAGMMLAAESETAPGLMCALEGSPGGSSLPRGAILSIFPHRTKPEITGGLLVALAEAGVYPVAVASSASAVSVLMPEEIVPKATEALFASFQFSAYRTPEDWKLTQKGKETLYREVVASYQEKSPKVYSLDWLEPLTLVEVQAGPENFSRAGAAFRHLALMGVPLSFMISASARGEGSSLWFCLPRSDPRVYADILSQHLPGAAMPWPEPAALFAMNGPHFGDRYGLAAQLLETLSDAGIDLLALGCAIASISGVVPGRQAEEASEAICRCFEVPAVNRKTVPPIRAVPLPT